MRIISGTHKGRRIAAPPGDSTRPTSDRVREALFNILSAVDDASVLDLFAGSGALGLEALSRGARRCVFVESDRVATSVIAENLAKLELTGAVVEKRDALAVLRDARARGTTYDLVFCDPPYSDWGRLEPQLAELLPLVLAADATLVVETGARTEPLLPLALTTSRRYGFARISIFTR